MVDKTDGTGSENVTGYTDENISDGSAENAEAAGGMQGVDGGASQRMSPYSTPSATRKVLEQHGLYTKYALGQNFLVNDDVIRKILELADVADTDSVLEIGPGIGTLTAALLQHAGHVTSIEADRDLPAVLVQTLAPWASRFTLLQMDALDLQVEDLSRTREVVQQPSSSPSFAQASKAARGALPNKLVSNLPYAIAATVVLDYFQRFDFLESATVMVQKEVADRMMARPGNKTYGAYTIKLSLVAEPAGRFSVAPGNFFPPPHVESSVVRLNRCVACDGDGQALCADELRAACTMADAAFATRRKTIANSCKTYFANNPDVQAHLPHLFETAGVNSKLRGEALAQADFIRMGKALLEIAS